jgi:hypothetical protein
MGESLAAAPSQHFQTNTGTTLLDEPKDFRGPARQIDYDAVGSKVWCRTSIQNPDSGRPTVSHVRDAKQCAERIVRVGCDHRVHVEPFAARGFLAVEFLTVIGGQPFSGLEYPRRAATWRCRRHPRGTAWKIRSQTHDHNPDGSLHALRSVAGAVDDRQGRPDVRRPSDLLTIVRGGSEISTRQQLTCAAKLLLGSSPNVFVCVLNARSAAAH